jgi:RIO kinase 1
MGVSVNRKGPSSYANAKDKSDRATSEQVLDPRTRIILFKMIGRGLIHEVNGCISTGKEVSKSYIVINVSSYNPSHRLMYIMPSLSNLNISP